MRRVFLQMMVSLDGYIEGPKKVDWHVWDDEMEKFGHEMLDPSIQSCWAGSYQLFADYCIRERQRTPK
jgi:hypothetical protein